MRTEFLGCVVIALAAVPVEVIAQRNPKKEAAFVVAHPAVGDPLPDVAVFNPDGTPFHTGDLRGHFTVLTFGCLT
jgi:hypothetical protein